MNLSVAPTTTKAIVSTKIAAPTTRRESTTTAVPPNIAIIRLFLTTKLVVAIRAEVFTDEPTIPRRGSSMPVLS